MPRFLYETTGQSPLMSNPLSTAWSAFQGLPQAIKSGGPVSIVLFAALVTGARGDWVFGRTYDEAVKRAEEYKTIAFNCVGIVVERAKESVVINEKVNPETAKPNASPTPKLAKITIPIAPLTAEEKRVEKPKDAEPQTLQKTIDTSKTIFDKNNLKQAQAEPAKKP